MANHESPESHVPTEEDRFGAGLTETDVLHFQAILREQTGVEVSLPEAWSRAIELLSLIETLYVSGAPLKHDRPGSPSGH